MTTAPLSAVPDTSDPPTAADIPRTRYSLTGYTRHRGRMTTSTFDFSALAMLDGGSMLNLASEVSDEQARALKVMLFRVTVDDDGVSKDVEPRFLTDDQVSYAWLDDDSDDDPGEEEDDGPVGPALIPDDARLKQLRKPELVDLAEAHQLDTSGTNRELIAGLQGARDFLAEQAGADLAVPDEDGTLEGEPVDAGAWRLVWPHDKREALTDPYELAVDEVFATREEATMHAADHGSSARQLAILLTDPDTVVPPASLNDAIGKVAGAAAGRPTERSRASRRSRAARARSRR